MHTPMPRLYSEVRLDGEIFRVQEITSSKALKLERISDRKVVQVPRKKFNVLCKQKRLVPIRSIAQRPNQASVTSTAPDSPTDADTPCRERT